MPQLDEIRSIINDYQHTPDENRVLTFIEFIKQYGFDNSPETFLSTYKEYVTRWALKKNQDIKMDDSEFVRQKMVDILKSITMTYSSYEEQQFIASINWSDPEQIKTVIPLYIRKIREICEFYRKKRNEAFLIVEKNKQKGSYKSIERIIYEKVVDFIFNNRNLLPQMAELKQNLMVSIEQYVDTYSEYFDIPRNKRFRKDSKVREDMIELNMNDIDYRNYIEINAVINEILYQGEVYLEEIPLIANLGLDFSQQCVGEMAALRNTLVNNATINLIPLNEQISIRRKFYEKFLGVDLYYMYVDDFMNIKLDLLCEAKNPSANLLNTQTAGRAVKFSEQVELLSHIGLFFKPDKTSILKVNAKDFTWEINKDKLIPNTVYVFPDPTRYGDIGNNKDPYYPLIMEYKTGFDIRNLSSGYAAHDPLCLLDEQAWSAYYSRQQDIFKSIDNKDFDYSFTSLANKGFIHNYQVDLYGNEYALYKGYYEVWKQDEDGNWFLDHVEIPGKRNPGFTTPEDDENDDKDMRHYILNGGYFTNPFNGEQTKKTYKDGVTLEIYLTTKAFPHGSYKNNHAKVNSDGIREFRKRQYRWTGSATGVWHYFENDQMFIPSTFTNPITTKGAANPFFENGKYAWAYMGEFGESKDLIYYDNYLYTEPDIDGVDGLPDVIDDVLEGFQSEVVGEDTDDTPVIEIDKSLTDLQSEPGTLLIKNNKTLEFRPLSFAKSFEWLDTEITSQRVVDFAVTKNMLVTETESAFYFIPYYYEDGEFKNGLELNKLITIPKDNNFYSRPLYNETEQCYYLLMMEAWQSSTYQKTLIPVIYKIDPKMYTVSIVQSGWRFITEWDNVISKELKNYYYPIDKVMAEQEKYHELAKANPELVDTYLFTHGNNLENFNFEYQDDISNSFGNYIQFTYNNNLNLYLIAYIYTDSNGLPQVFEHRFKIGSNELFNRSLVSNMYSVTGSEEAVTIYNEYIDSGITTSDDKQMPYFFIKIK